MSGGWVYIETSDKDGTRITDHQTWDSERFVAARRKEALKSLGIVRVLSVQEYQDYKFKDAPGRAAKRKKREGKSK